MKYLIPLLLTIAACGTVDGRPTDGALTQAVAPNSLEMALTSCLAENGYELLELEVNENSFTGSVNNE
jgi:hypothetical protein